MGGGGSIDEACERAGRDPTSLARSACVLVRFPDGAGERPDEPGVEALDPSDLPAALGAFADAGADDVILVCDPITEASIRPPGALLAYRLDAVDAAGTCAVKRALAI